MSLSFQRQQAGEYNVLDNGKAVAYIQKANSSKWITYFCTNPAIKGKPQYVAKTLKESKAFCESSIGSANVETSGCAPVKAAPAPKSTAKMTAKMDPEKRKAMEEMMARDYVINLNEYKQTENGLERVSTLITENSTEEELMAL